MNDFPGFNWVVNTHTDAEVEHYEHDTQLLCGALIVIATLALLLESNVKYVIWVVLALVYGFKKLSF